MISTVSLLGQASDQIVGFPEFRYIDIESSEPFDENSYFSKIPVMYWDRSCSNPFINIPNGHFVVIFGRLESHPKLGIYVLAEQIRHFPSNLLIHQKKESKKKLK